MVREDFAAMRQYLDRAIALGPVPRSLPDVLLLRGYSALQLSNYEDCRRDYQAYLDLRPGEPTGARRSMALEISTALALSRPASDP